ncbi:hypothetical protein [Paraburkholderia sp. BL23I1N1]|uniref:hypothetical protein n=1 Tax=Paraburkholderia sp. BL23I1N1 TaxID=1938802 RepID=UPI0011C34ACE|nr:hypothetical protein [Paraburkholderia sp. BL23I1N1]
MMQRAPKDIFHAPADSISSGAVRSTVTAGKLASTERLRWSLADDVSGLKLKLESTDFRRGRVPVRRDGGKSGACRNMAEIWTHREGN